MKIMTPAEMREADRRAIEAGIPGIVLMENAGLRVVEFLAARCAPLSHQRIVIFCGKGNNAGDGLVVARHLLLRYKPAAMHVILAADPDEFHGEAAVAFKMYQVCGGEYTKIVEPVTRAATVIVDALLGTGVEGELKEPYADFVREINGGFPLAKVVAVDVPSRGVHADYTVTFAAPKISLVVPPGYLQAGELIVADIGIPPGLLNDVRLNLSQPSDFTKLFAPRPRDSNKGMYGHVLVIGGARGKAGAAVMTGMAALRAGAGLVTVASESEAYPPELMTASLDDVDAALKGKTMVALGPGLGNERVEIARRLFKEVALPMVVDADGLNALAGSDFRGGAAARILTPHPGEMARLCSTTMRDVQSNRLEIARRLAGERNVILVLKGDRTVIALPDGRAWINPTGTPALATGGTGDILTGIIAGLYAQTHDDLAVRASVWLHGRAGEMGAAALGEQGLIATDLLRYLPEAMRESVGV